MKHKFIKDGKPHWALRIKIPILICLLLFLVPCLLYAQEPGDTLWTRTYGGDLYDHGYSVRQTIDGGYILVGMTTSFGVGSADFWLLKTDAIGDTMWTKIYGWAREEIAWDVEQTADSGYIVTGHTSSTPMETSSIWLMKTDSNGDTLWTRIYGGDSWEKSFSVQPTTDGGYIVVGRTRSFGAGYYDIWLLKTDSDGDTLWTRTYGGSSREDGYCVRQTTDGGYIISGATRSYGAGDGDFWLLKTDENGDTLWTRTYGGSNGENSYSVQQTPDGGYILSGYTMSYGAGGADAWLVKTDENGDTLWTRTYGASDRHEMDARVRLTSDGGYIIGGRTEIIDSADKDFYLVRTDANGDTLWTGSYGGNGAEFCFSAQQTYDGGYIALGYTTSFGSGPSDVYLVKVAGELPTGSISGVVTEAESGVPIQGVYVEALETGINDLTDINGEYTLPELYPRIHEISFSHEDYRDTTVTGVEVISGEVTVLDVEMSLLLSPGTISGVVTESATGDPIAGVLVEAIGEDVSDNTDLEGQYTLADLYPGTYDVSFSHFEYRDTTVTGVIVTAGNTTELNVVMELTNNIPTLSEWGMIVLALLLLAAGTAAVVRRRRVVTEA